MFAEFIDKDKDLIAFTSKLFRVVRESLKKDIRSFQEILGSIDNEKITMSSINTVHKEKIIMSSINTVETFDKKIDEIFGEENGPLKYQQSAVVDQKQEEVTDIYTLSQVAESLRDFTREWVLLREVWEYYLPDLKIINENIDALKAIELGTRLIDELYQSTNTLEPMSKLPLPVVVPFMGKMYATGFDYPLPFIVSPIWGFRQIWSWFGYAHEFGHHIYRNTQGLKQELRAHVMGTLSLNRVDYTMQKIWFTWLEEIFADIFGILQLGVAFVRSQRYIFFYIPKHVIKLFKTNLKEYKDSPEKVNNRIFLKALGYSTDDTHPVPYLRSLLAIKASRKLVEYICQKSDECGDYSKELEKEITELQRVWDKVFNGVNVDTVKIATPFQFPHHLLMLTGQAYVDKEVQTLKNIGDIVIETVLKTKFDALSGQTILDVFFNCPNRACIDEAKNLITIEGYKISAEYQDKLDMRYLLIAAQEILEDKLLADENVKEILDLNNKVLSVMDSIP